MEHQKVLNILNKGNQAKFVTRKLNIANDQSNANYDLGNEIIYNTEALKSKLCDQYDAYILVRGDITVAEAPATQVSFKNYSSYTKCITKIDDKTIDDAEDLHLVIPVYNSIEYRSNCFEKTGGLWFYSKDAATDFNYRIANTDDLKFFKYMAKLLEDTETQPNPNNATGILKNATIPVSLKYLSNFWRSPEMPLINCKAKLKVTQAKYYVLSAARNDNVHDNANNIIFTVTDTKLYVPFVILSTRDNKKLPKFFSKGIFVYWNEYDTKSENKNTAKEYRYFLKSDFIGVNRLFVLVYSNHDAASKRIENQKYYLPKGIITKYNVIINGKKIYDQPIDSDIKRQGPSIKR